LRPTRDEAFDLEVLEEKAVALARVADHLQQALAALREVDERRRRLPEPSPALEERRLDLLAEACDRAWCFVVQREAMGLRTHEAALDVYAVPPEVRFRMGPRGPR
jgi:uncharacterized protein DUF6665